MKIPAVAKVRSTIWVPDPDGMPPIERDLHWRTDEVYPYCYLDGYVIRVTDHGAFTQWLGAKGAPVGKVLNWSGLAEALSVLGWEPC